MSEIENIVRAKRPKLGFAADYKNSRRAAIHLMCITCMGGVKSDVENCTSYSCPLWTFRCAKNRKRPEGAVPEEQEYKKKLARLATKARTEQGKKLGKRNENNF